MINFAPSREFKRIGLYDMLSHSDKITVADGDVAANPAGSVSESTAESSYLRKEEHLNDEEKRQRREARMKKRLAKQERKREKMREMAQQNDNTFKEEQISIERHHDRLEVPKTASSTGGETSLKLKIKVKKKQPEQKVPAETAKSQDSKSDGNRDKTKKSKPPKICFPINEECTSVKLAPSGRHIIAGFTDGTLRLFDTTGRLWKPRSLSGSNNALDDATKSEISSLFDSDSDEENDSNLSKRSSKQRMVASKSFQNYGAVACQIHAKGVITSLLMDVDCCEDGRFAFGGVLRGSTELIAVDLSGIEKFHDEFFDKGDQEDTKRRSDILDLIKVYRYSDAKLKGFGACIKLKNTDKLEYRLFTGKGIKNMHIWSFIPPSGDVKEPTWQCLYDTPTNGNTITYLKFRRDAYGLLQGISKSDDQKLRIWDLSYEEHGPKKRNPHLRSIIKQLAQKSEKENCEGRPKRPPHVDVLSTENALGVCGAYVFSGGDSMYNKMGVMYLDVDDIQSQFNHTELALPNVSDSAESLSFLDTGRRTARTGRQQRGDLKSVVKVAGLSNDAHHVLLELSDQTLVHYCQKGNQSSLTPLRLHNPSQAGRKIGVTYVHLKDSYVLTISSYDAAKSRGAITLRYLSDNLEQGSVGHSVRMAFTEGKVNSKKSIQISNILNSKKLTQCQKANEISANDKKAHLKHIDNPQKSLESVREMEKLDNRKEVIEERAILSTPGISNHRKSNEEAENRKSNWDSTFEKKSNTKKDESQSQRTYAINSIGMVSAAKESHDTKIDQKTRFYNDTSASISSVPELKERNILVSIQSNIAISNKSGDIARSSQTSGKKEDNAMSSKTILKSKGADIRMRSNSIHSKAPVAKTFVSSNEPMERKALPVAESSKVEKYCGSNLPIQNTLPTENITSPLPLKSSHLDNSKLTTSMGPMPSEKGTNDSNLLVTPDFKNREKSLSKLKTPVEPLSLQSSITKNALEAVNHYESKTNRAAVSPEQSKKDELDLSVNAVIDKSKSISKFFKDVKEHKGVKIAKGIKTEIKKRTKTSQEDINEVKRKRKQLYQEIDVASALCELRRIASFANTSAEPPINSGVEQSSPIWNSSLEMKEYLAHCHKRKRPKFSKPTNLPSVSVRTGINVPVYKDKGTIFSKGATLLSDDALAQSHFEARRRLAMHHRASHERLKSAVISSGERMMNLVTCNIASSTYNKNQFIEYVSCALSQELDQHRETLNDMLERQRMEAASLASIQMLEKGVESPMLSVSFPFPEVFDQVKLSTIKFLSNV